MASPFTQLVGSATPSRRYGSFSGRIAVVEAPSAAPIWVRTDHRMGRFAEIQLAARYVELVIVELPPIWDIVANDHVDSIDISVELGYFSFAASEWLIAHSDATVRMGFATVGCNQDTLTSQHLLLVQLHPCIMEAHESVQLGPKHRRAILEAEQLLGISDTL